MEYSQETVSLVQLSCVRQLPCPWSDTRYHDEISGSLFGFLSAWRPV